jgi:predicted nucleic acid-binding protein
VKPVLVDSSVLLDLLTDDPKWSNWSASQLVELGEHRVLVINPIVYAEVSIGFTRIEDLDAALPREFFRRDELPYEAGFLAGKAFLSYRKRGGVRAAPLPDFFVGAHAAIGGMMLLTRDAKRVRTYFPTVEIIAPS